MGETLPVGIWMRLKALAWGRQGGGMGDDSLSGGCQTRSSSLQFREARHDKLCNDEWPSFTPVAVTGSTCRVALLEACAGLFYSRLEGSPPPTPPLTGRAPDGQSRRCLSTLKDESRQRHLSKHVGVSSFCCDGRANGTAVSFCPG